MVIFNRQTVNSYTKSTNCVQQLLLLYSKNCESTCREIANLNLYEKNLIIEYLLDICEDCARMAALPQGAFAACKLRENYRDRNLTIARMKSSGSGDKNDAKNMSQNKKLMEYSPVKYNGKLMNSIWGLYNRYSPHNIKGNEYESMEQNNFVQQHPSAVASFAIAHNLTMAMGSGNEWRFLEK